jgi:ubiquinone/menaquinone biosynthesis C-methylase UbiE
LSIDTFISKHLSAPKGIGGKAVSYVMNRQNRPMYEETIRLLSLSGAETVLDIGCGNGYVLNMIAQRHDGIYTGIDLSESIIKAAINRNRTFVNSGKMVFHCQDLSAMSFAKESFSKAYTINTVYFWNSLDSVMDRISRILKPSGVFVNTLYSNATLDRISHTQHGYKRFTTQELTAAGGKVGFSVDAVPILGGAAFCYIYRKPPYRGA